jgi:hypothetical protein
MSFKCGSCRERHEHIEQVKQCFGLDVGLYLGPCTWQTQGRTITTGDPEEPYYYDAEGVTECGAKMYAREDGTGYDCLNGHDHTTAEARYNQGWDYAEDEDEAKQLVKAGVEPRHIEDGTPYI